MALHIGVGHAERVNTHLHARLTKHQRTSNELEDLINTLIGHCVAADGNTIAVDHQVFPFITMRTVIGIGETNINRFVVTAVWF
ncbi:Uncharacterised protein [Shigella sonnei]|nr:Uncharacterised protein [Shigella sonnei]